MKTLFFIISFFVLTLSSFAQTTYYQNGNGSIIDDSTYQEQKTKQLEKIRTAMKSDKFEIIERLTTLRQDEDSIIMSFSWLMTDNVKRTQKEEDSKQGLVGKPFPFEKLNLEDKINTEKLKGKPTLINLWFVGCAPCVEEMPVLNEFKEHYGDSINFISLSYSSDKQVKKFLQKYSFTFEHYTNLKELSKKLNINSYPNNILMDKNGIVTEVTGGISYELDKETKELKMGDGKELKEKLDKLLQE